ncbi:MAG: urease accessory protein [Rhizorhabdus sp.]|nr:urease accessory protein [Rhizorhabdus sp.]
MKQGYGIDSFLQTAEPARATRADEAAALVHVRSRGEIRLGFQSVAGRTTIAEGYQGGCLKFRMPHYPASEAPSAILLNVGGGLTGGDRLSQQIAWGRDSAAGVTTQAAEKIYRAIHDEAAIETRLDIGAGAHAEWLPQETILFDRARLRRDTRVRMADDAAFLGVEAVVLGRTAMDETMQSGALIDRWRIWRAERLIYADALRLEGPVDDLMQRKAIGNGARAMAVIVHVSSRASSLLSHVREALEGAIGMAAASCWNGMLVTRLLARNGAILRHDMLRALAALRGGRAMPRVWSC